MKNSVVLRLPFLMVLAAGFLVAACGEQATDSSGDTAVADVAVVEQDQCLTCHKDPVIKVKYKALYDYYVEYVSTAHGAAGLSCVDCHGGNPAAVDFDLAHEGVRERLDRALISDTCGGCHGSQFKAFVSGEAHAGLEEEGGDVPMCTDCHGSMKMELMPPENVLPKCQRCHRIDRDDTRDVATRTERLLGLIKEISVAKGQLEASGADEQALVEIARSCETLVWHWHRLDLDQAETVSLELLVKLDAAQKGSTVGEE